MPICSVQTSPVAPFSQPPGLPPPEATAVAERGQVHLHRDRQWPRRLHFDLDSLQGFEAVDRAFSRWGVTFKNAIALQPSNAAFPTRSYRHVLMGAPEPGAIEIEFHRPVRWAMGYVTASRRTLLTAEMAGEIVDRAELSQANLAGSNRPLAPNACLKVEGNAIDRVTFYGFESQFTLSELCIGF